VGIISRAQRYKKPANTEQEVEKICVFLIRDNTYMTADIQNIAFLISASGISRTLIRPQVASRSNVPIIKKFEDDLTAVENTFLGILCGRNVMTAMKRSKRNTEKTTKYMHRRAFSDIPSRNPGE
jgi:hypothetical protein